MKISYKVIEINGDYVSVISEKGVENSIAVFLLPSDLQVGDTVIFEDFQYRKES